MIGDLRIEHGWTIDEIRAKLVELGQGVSRSALGRHVKSLEEIGADLRHSREVANALVGQIGDAPEDKTAALNIELMHSLVLRLLTATNDAGDGKPVVFDTQDVMFLSRSMQSLANAKKANVDTFITLRDDTLKQAAKAVDTAAKKIKGGLTKDVIDTIKREILGIAA